MAIEAYDEQKVIDDVDDDDDDDDDVPLIFKRSSSSAKPNSETRKSLSQKNDQQLGRRGPPLNGQSTSVEKSKMVGPSSKTPPVKSHLTSPKSSNSSAKASSVQSVKSHLTSPKSSNSSAKASSVQSSMVKSKPSTSMADERKSVNRKLEGEKSLNRDSEDSEDDKPLSSRLLASQLKVNSNHSHKGASASTVGQKSKIPKSEEDSDDEILLSCKFPLKSNVGNSVSSSSISGDRKPSLAKSGQKGSASTEKKPPTILKKRPADSVKSTDASNLKKPKLSVASPTNRNKESSIKAEIKEEEEEDDEDHIPISQRMKKTPSSDKKSALVKNMIKPKFGSANNKKSNKFTKNSKYTKSSKVQPSSGEGQKWTTLVHNGVIFPPPYKPHGVKILYKGRPVDLTPEQEEVATMYAVMLDTDYMNKPKFKENFMSDWRKILGKNHTIQSLEHCDFTPIYEWHQREKEKKKQMTSEEKKALREEKLKQEEKYMWAILDGVKEKVGNFRVEPPGLFRGRGEHPRMGRLKKRIRPSDIVINIGKDAPLPECPIPGESWKEVRHDNTVTWLAYWNDPINQKEFKYVFLAASSSLKGQSDKEKYEKARLLKDYIQGIRAAYTKDFASKDSTKKQIAVATYLIDILALRAGNEKDDDEADTVGCCTLKVENVEPVPPNILKFDFLGKDSIRYQNSVDVDINVFKAIQQFQSGKKGGEDLFDMLDTSKLNAHLKGLMPGLTAKVFRTYNASITLDDLLTSTTKKSGELADKFKAYQEANKRVAIICNHQRAESKTHSAQIAKLDDKIRELKGTLDECKKDLARVKKGKPPSNGTSKRNINSDALERKMAQTTSKIEKLERDKDLKEELKNVALGTSKINYLDPRITVAWCKRHEVPIEKMFNKSLIAKFAWAMDVDPGFRF